jgi:signal transduction histidine kinase
MKSLADEERRRIELWAEATQQLINAIPGEDVNFFIEVIRNNETIPVIIVDTGDNITSYRNLDSLKMQNPEFRKKKIYEFKNNQKDHFLIKENDTEFGKIYYSDSLLLIRLQYYPLIQLAVVFLFILVAYFAFSISRKAEQNQVWLGMSKETAHQLGTPISSLMAWHEILKESENNREIINEVGKDISRLEKIAARFSKIGSQPILENTNLYDIIKNSLNYMASRIPKTIQIETIFNSNKIYAPINTELFEWVIENLCKNAVDAIGESGKITVSVHDSQKNVFIDFHDTGKGISKSNQKAIFSPGYTTKSRGWGLGLSLAKRIIEQYHKGKIFVKNSEIGVGTTFRIVLKKEYV